MGELSLLDLKISSYST